MATAVMQEQNGTQTTMSNKTTFPMSLTRSYNYSGKPLGAFPESIYPNSSSTFTHLRGNFFGSKAYVVYDGRNAQGIDCSWLLAWHAPADSTPDFPNRVFVACGPKETIGYLDNHQIEQKLATGATFSTITDPATKTFVYGNISDSVPEIATLVADFKLIP